MTRPTAGIATHILRSFDPAKHLRLLAAHDIHLIELSCGLYPYLADDGRFAGLRRALADSHIQVYSVHVPFSGAVPELGQMDISHPDGAVREKVVAATMLCAERLAALGGRCLIIHPSCEPVEEADRPRRLDTAREGLLSLKSRVAPDGRVRIAIENLPRSNIGRDSAELVALVEKLDSPLFGICLDVNHANLREDLLEATRNYAPHVLTTHVSDNDGAGERHWLPGRGVIPFKEWIATLRACGYAGPFLYETGQAEGESDEQTVAAIAENMRELFGAPER